MLKKLRLKIILAIVLVAAVMLGAILGLFYTLTKQNLRTQSTVSYTHLSSSADPSGNLFSQPRHTGQARCWLYLFPRL